MTEIEKTYNMPKKMTETEHRSSPLSELTAISILDGRNREQVAQLAEYVSEYNLIRTRFEVESAYLIALSQEGITRKLSSSERRQLESFGKDLSLDDARKVKEIENRTRHDVKAMERSFRQMLSGTSLQDVIEMVHFGLTSEDVNNIAYRLILKRATENIFIPLLDSLIEELAKRADDWKDFPMLARTHGQAAVPTTLGKEIINFAVRVNKQVRELELRKLEGKMTGAVGNLNALRVTYPNINWISFSENFVRSFGFEPNLTTSQINPYEDTIAYFQNYQRINNIILDFDQDMWRYISDGWFLQGLHKGEVGSSTMPQKVNPIRLENSEGNLGKANALFEYFSRKLGISRLQRDLSDSTVIRDMGVPLGYSLLSYQNTLLQINRIKANKVTITEALNSDWSILSEAAQTIMRRYGVKDPYSLMAEYTQGKTLDQEAWASLVDQLPLDEEVKMDLASLVPENYIGYAIELTEKAILEIKSSRRKK